MAVNGPRDGWLRTVVEDVVRSALGRQHRDDADIAPTGGPAGNARLTAWIGLLLLVLFVAETATLLSLRRLVVPHLIIGAALVPLVTAKTATTGWRIVRYYTGNSAYRVAGPPPLLLRILGPLVVLTGFGVLGTGLALIALGRETFDTIIVVAGQPVNALLLHKLAFAAWLVVVGAHTLVRLVPATRLVAGRSGPAQGGRTRVVVLAMTLAIAGLAGGAILPWSGAWTGHHGAAWQDRFDSDDSH